MKVKTINAVLAKKFDDWVESIDDPQVRNAVKRNTVISGGCIASMLLGEDVNDFDLYFTDEETTLAVAKYYVDKFNASNDQANDTSNSITPVVENEDGRVRIVVRSAGVVSVDSDKKDYQYFEMAAEGEAGDYIDRVMASPPEEPEQTSDKYHPVFLSENAITLTNDIQLVIRFYGDPEEIHANYDYVHCMNYWTSRDRSTVTKKEALESLLSKELKYVGSLYPLCSLIRMRKFLARGWRITAGQILKMAFQVSELDLNDLTVLKDQLTGVDVAYFMEVVSALKTKQAETGSDRVDSAYLMEIIDRMF